MNETNQNRSLKVLYVIPTLRFRDGGPTQALIEMSREMARRGHRVAIYCTSHHSIPGEDSPDTESFNRQGIELNIFRLSRLFDFKFAPELDQRSERRFPTTMSYISTLSISILLR